MTCILIYLSDHIGSKVDNLFEVLWRHVKQVAQTGWNTLEEPDSVTGAASSMCPIRSRRTRERVTSTPQRSHTMPLKRTRLYFPHAHSQSQVGPKICSPNTVLFRLQGTVINGLGFFTSPWDQPRISSAVAKPIRT